MQNKLLLIFGVVVLLISTSFIYSQKWDQEWGNSHLSNRAKVITQNKNQTKFKNQREEWVTELTGTNLLLNRLRTVLGYNKNGTPILIVFSSLTDSIKPDYIYFMINANTGEVLKRILIRAGAISSYSGGPMINLHNKNDIFCENIFFTGTPQPGWYARGGINSINMNSGLLGPGIKMFDYSEVSSSVYGFSQKQQEPIFISQSVRWYNYVAGKVIDKILWNKKWLHSFQVTIDDDGFIYLLRPSKIDIVDPNTGNVTLSTDSKVVFKNGIFHERCLVHIDNNKEKNEKLINLYAVGQDNTNSTNRITKMHYVFKYIINENYYTQKREIVDVKRYEINDDFLQFYYKKHSLPVLGNDGKKIFVSFIEYDEKTSHIYGLFTNSQTQHTKKIWQKSKIIGDKCDKIFITKKNNLLISCSNDIYHMDSNNGSIIEKFSVHYPGRNYHLVLDDSNNFYSCEEHQQRDVPFCRKIKLN